MERLTERLEDGQAVMKCEECEVRAFRHCTAIGCRNRLKDRLAAYEDAAEQGLLVRLPCKVGDTVWVIFTSYVYEELGDPPETRHYIESRPFKLSMLENFSKTVFLTREEAEATLAKED